MAGRVATSDWLNAGMWIPPDDIEAGFGEEVGSQLNRMLGAAPSLVFSLVDSTTSIASCAAKARCTWRTTPAAKQICAVVKNNGSAVARRLNYLTGQACEQATGTQKIAAALLDRRAGTVNPMASTTGLAKAAIGLGGQLFDHSPVTRLERQGQRWSAKLRRVRYWPSKW